MSHSVIHCLCLGYFTAILIRGPRKTLRPKARFGFYGYVFSAPLVLAGAHCITFRHSQPCGRGAGCRIRRSTSLFLRRFQTHPAPRHCEHGTTGWSPSGPPAVSSPPARAISLKVSHPQCSLPTSSMALLRLSGARMRVPSTASASYSWPSLRRGRRSWCTK